MLKISIRTNLISRRRQKSPLNGTVLSVVSEHKILNLTFDKNLIGNNTIIKTKANCLKRIDILKTLAHYRCDVVKVYRSLVRSRLDYGNFIYMSPSNYELNAFNSIHNTALRKAFTGKQKTPSVAMTTTFKESINKPK